MVSTRPPGRFGQVFLILFFSIFAFVGCWATYQTFLVPTGKVLAATHWVQTPCQILWSGVGSHKARKNGTTYSVQVDYQYSFNGQSYHSEQYSFDPGSSSGYEGKQAIVNRYPARSPSVCYVNPQAPEEAVLERRFTGGLLLGLLPLIFAVIGVGGIIWTIRAPRKEADRIAKVSGPEPWMSRTDWAAGRVAPSQQGGAKFFWGFALFWNLISTPVLFFIVQEASRQGHKVMLVFLIFPVIGVGLLIAAIYQTLKWMKYGRALLEMNSRPLVRGGALEGTLRLGQLIRPESSCHLRLCCLRAYITGSGKNQQTHETILYESEQDLSCGMTDALPVLFSIPIDSQDTTLIDPRDRILWRLTAKAKTPGIDLSLNFELPVFGSNPTASQAAIAARAVVLEKTAKDIYQLSPESRVHVTDLHPGREFIFPAARNIGSALLVTIILIVWTGIVMGIWVSHISVFAFAFFMFFEPLLFWGTLRSWFYSLRVVIQNGILTARHGLLGIHWQRSVPVGEISGIQTIDGQRSGNTLYHDLKITVRPDKKLILRVNLTDKRDSDWLAAEMSQAAGVK